MPAALRALTITVCALLAAGVAAVTAGCGGVGAAQNTVDRAGLVNDLASRLDGAGHATYTAEYQLPGGATATIAQGSQGTAFVYAGGRLLLTPDETAECQADNGSTTCTITPPMTPGVDPEPPALARVGAKGLVPPALVVNMLTAAALDTNAVIQQHDTTLAGQHATCVDVTGMNSAQASPFSACVTVDGVLGSFTGRVGESSVDITLSRYDQTVAPDAFILPAGAKVVDNRPAN